MTEARRERPVLSDTLNEGLEGYRIGPKLRALRRARGLALADLSAHSGLSQGMLSKVERGQVYPTLPTLLRVAMVFGVGLDHFFRPDEDRPMFVISRAADRLALPVEAGGAGGVDGSESSDGAGEADGFAAARSDVAYRFESLDFEALRRGFEGYLAVFPADGPASAPHEHVGEELVYVLEGMLEITAHGQAHRLAAGDAVHFDARFAHGYRGAGPGPTRALVVASRPPDSAA